MINVNISDLKKINVDWVDSEMNIGISKNDNVFRILIYFASLFKNEIFLDLGTNVGHSALALRAGSYDNLIISYDIQKNNIPYGDNKYNNIIFKIMDINQEHPSILKNSKLMYLDVDPHDGYQEFLFINKLRKINYKGFVLCDDININDGMRLFWNSIKENKFDFSGFGHHTGTGLICFNEEIRIIN